MFGKFGVVRNDPAQINDLLDLAVFTGPCKVVGHDQICVLERGLIQAGRRHHAVYEVNGDVDLCAYLLGLQQGIEITGIPVDILHV
ncbi:hypothetical protein D3C72_1408330 [compost metagenome]